MSITPLAFPLDRPHGYEELRDEPVWDPARHLVPTVESENAADQASDKTVKVEMLSDFGYTPEQIAACPSPVAVAGPFRLLSAQGVADAQAVLTRLRATAQADVGNRAPNYLAGGVYKSKFLRDMCYCPELIRRMSRLMATTLAPHTMPTQQLYVNFAPEDISKAVDSWHVDSIDYDCVILLEDPFSCEGGHFQYFRGTINEAAELFGTTVDDLPTGFSRELPAHRVVSVQNQQPGDCVVQQGARVIHRAERLAKRAERTTMVISFVPASVAYQDNNNLARLLQWDMPGTQGELARHCAWRAQARLSELMNELSVNAPTEEIAPRLQQAIADVSRLLDLLSRKSP